MSESDPAVDFSHVLRSQRQTFSFDSSENSMSDLFRRVVLCLFFLANLLVDDSRLKDSSSLISMRFLKSH